jgi:hypothetical protein
MNIKFLVAAAIGCVSLTSNAAMPPVTNPCSFSDLSGVAVTQCAGFFAGNLINNSPTDIAAVKSILYDAFGIASPSGLWLEKLSGLNGAQTINFATPLSGPTIVALHFGNGQGGPGNATAFYEFNAGANLDSFTTRYTTSSNAAIYLTNPVPEPESYAMLLAGLGLMGAVVRRRTRKSA